MYATGYTGFVRTGNEGVKCHGMRGNTEVQAQEHPIRKTLTAGIGAFIALVVEVFGRTPTATLTSDVDLDGTGTTPHSPHRDVFHTDDQGMPFFRPAEDYDRPPVWKKESIGPKAVFHRNVTT